MTNEQREQIIITVKTAINNNSSNLMGATIISDDNGIDHIAEEVADTLIENNYRKINDNYKQFLFVEDGSVDIETLADELAEKNPAIKIVVYRQGSRIPELKDMEQ